MSIPVNKPLVEQLIKDQYGTVDDLLVEWEYRCALNKKFAKPREASRVYKYSKGELPKKEDTLFSYCALLNADPIAIVDTSQEFVAKHYWKERLHFFSSEKKTLLAPFRPLFLPGQQWPDNSIVETYYDRTWHTEEFLFAADTMAHGYAAVYITPQDELPLNHPRVFHFAYQVKGAPDQLWRPYGITIGYHDRVRLIHERGVWQEIAKPEHSKDVIAETFFGPDSCWFRVASLHPFEIGVVAPSPETNVVRFP